MYPVVQLIEVRGWVARMHQVRRGRGDRMADVELARQLLQREGRLLLDRY